MNYSNEKLGGASEQRDRVPTPEQIPGKEEPAMDLQEWLQRIGDNGGQIAKEAKTGQTKIHLDPENPNLGDVQAMLNQTMSQGDGFQEVNTGAGQEEAEDVLNPETAAQLTEISQNVSRDELVNEPAIAEPYIKNALTILLKDALVRAKNDIPQNSAYTLNRIITLAASSIKKNGLMCEVFTNPGNANAVISTLNNIFAENIDLGPRKLNRTEVAILTREFILKLK